MNAYPALIVVLGLSATSLLIFGSLTFDSSFLALGFAPTERAPSFDSSTQWCPLKRPGLLLQRDENNEDATRTLVVIYGQERTLLTVLPYIVENLIVPNEPCDVILALDPPSQPYPSEAETVLSKWLLPRPGPPTPGNASIEFRVQDAAFGSVATNLSRYAWAVTTRTDTLPKYPFCPRCVAGDVNLRRLVNEFCDFGLRVSALTRGPTDYEAIMPPVKDHVFYWLVGAGNFQFAFTRTEPGKMRRKTLSPWCPAYVPRCLLDRETESLRAAIEKIPDVELQDPISLRHHLRRLVKDFRISWLAGSTWMRLGTTQSIASSTRSVLDHWGRSFPEAGLTTMSLVTNLTEKYRQVTESQLRMAMFEAGTMIELSNLPDYWVSFSEQQAALNIPEKFARFSTVYFILREPGWPRRNHVQ